MMGKWDIGCDSSKRPGAICLSHAFAYLVPLEPESTLARPPGGGDHPPKLHHRFGLAGVSLVRPPIAL